MKTFKEIFIKEAMTMPNAFGIARVQRANLNESVSFYLDDESREFLRDNLTLAGLTGKIYEPTMKKISENILILNRQRHSKTGLSRLTLMNNQHYNYRNSSFYTSTLN